MNVFKQRVAVSHAYYAQCKSCGNVCNGLDWSNIICKRCGTSTEASLPLWECTSRLCRIRNSAEGAKQLYSQSIEFCEICCMSKKSADWKCFCGQWNLGGLEDCEYCREKRDLPKEKSASTPPKNCPTCGKLNQYSSSNCVGGCGQDFTKLLPTLPKAEKLEKCPTVGCPGLISELLGGCPRCPPPGKSALAPLEVKEADLPREQLVGCPWNCGAVTNDGCSNCGGCGGTLFPLQCQGCKALNDPSNSTCIDCGARFEQALHKQAPPKQALLEVKTEEVAFIKCSACTYDNSPESHRCEICRCPFEKLLPASVRCAEKSSSLAPCQHCGVPNLLGRTDCIACDRRLDGGSSLPNDHYLCPHCGIAIYLEQVNCAIVRCGGNNAGAQLGQHLTEEEAKKRMGGGDLRGCGKQSQLVNGNLVACTGK